MTPLMLAAISEAPNDSRSEASTRSVVTVLQKPARPRSVVFSTSAAIGSSTIRHSQNRL